MDGEVDELAGGVLGGEAALGLDRLAQLAVEGLDRVCGVDDAADLWGERQKRDHVLPAVAPRLDDRWQLRAPLLLKGLERLEGVV